MVAVHDMQFSYGLRSAEKRFVNNSPTEFVPKVTFSRDQLTEYYTGMLFGLGFNKSDNVFNPDFLNRTSNQIFLSKPVDKADIAQFNQSGSGININSTTVQVTDLLREVGTIIGEKCFLEMFAPDVLSQSVQTIVDTIDPVSGAQSARKPSSTFNVIPKLGNSSALFNTAYWGEKFVVNEEDIISLREIGTNNFSVPGIAQYMSIWTEQLAIRAYTLKMILLQEAIFSGQFSWYGQTFSFGVPSQNTLLPLNGQPWATYSSAFGWVMNPNALPLTDIRYYISTSPTLRRLKPLLKGIAMNRVTHNMFYTNPEVQQLIQYGYMANENIIAAHPRGATMESMIQYFLGGDREVAVYVDDTNYIADSQDPLGNAAGTCNYFIPDGQILFVYDFTKGGYGGGTADYVYTPAIQNGTYLDPRPGLFMQMQYPVPANDLETPQLKCFCGSNSMPRIKRPNDLYVLNAF